MGRVREETRGGSMVMKGEMGEEHICGVEYGGNMEDEYERGKRGEDGIQIQRSDGDG